MRASRPRPPPRGASTRGRGVRDTHARARRHAPRRAHPGGRAGPGRRPPPRSMDRRAALQRGASAAACGGRRAGHRRRHHRHLRPLRRLDARLPGLRSRPSSRRAPSAGAAGDARPASGPDILLDVPVEIGLARKRGAETRFEAAFDLAYHERVRLPALRRGRAAALRIIDAARSPEAIFDDVVVAAPGSPRSPPSSMRRVNRTRLSRIIG